MARRTRVGRIAGLLTPGVTGMYAPSLGPPSQRKRRKFGKTLSVVPTRIGGMHRLAVAHIDEESIITGIGKREFVRLTLLFAFLTYALYRLLCLTF
jgi:hypothetical protein